MPVRSPDNGLADLANTIRTQRADVGVLAASSTKDVTVTWTTPFADANYTVVAMLVDTAATANADALRQAVGTPTPTGVTIRVASGAAPYTAGQLLVHAIAIHD